MSDLGSAIGAYMGGVILLVLAGGIVLLGGSFWLGRISVQHNWHLPRIVFNESADPR